MTKKQIWYVLWSIGVYGYFAGILFWTRMAIPSDVNPYPPLPVYVLILWIVLPIVWMFSIGFGLSYHFEYELGWREEHYGPNGEYVRSVDTTPAKRIALQWLAPFALCYFVACLMYRQRKAVVR